jgi:acyl carrier protein
MDSREIRATVVKALCDVAPDLDAASLEGDAPLRARYDLDSADYLNFILLLHERLGVAIPETDYPKLATIDAATRYLSDAGRLGQKAH